MIKLRKTQNAQLKTNSTAKTISKVKMRELKNTGQMKAVNGARGFFVSLRPGAC